MFTNVLIILSLTQFEKILFVEAGTYDYGEVLGKSLLFYEAQRSGKLPLNKRVLWRGNSFLNDKGNNGEVLSGGYFDGGDYMKFGFPMAAMTTIMGWGILDYRVGYEKAGQLNNSLAALRWATDYLLQAHPSPDVLYVQVGNPDQDHTYWGRPEDYPNTVSRPVYQINTTSPGSEVAAETAAALAVSSMIFNISGDNAYAEKCLVHAKQLYRFATKYLGIYSDSVPSVQPYYKSWTGYGDEFAWAAAWLYRATKSPEYLANVEEHWDTYALGEIPSEFSWDWKTAGMQVLMAKINGSQKYQQSAKAFCDWAIYTAPRSPKKLASKLPLVGSEGNAYLKFAKQQIDYILGDTGRSYVVGYGKDFPKQPRHAASSCRPPPSTCDWKDFKKKDANPNILSGALIGGPGRKDTYVDKRKDAMKNDVGIVYNAGFQSALAALNYLTSINTTF